jgi:hypothetical protein
MKAKLNLNHFTSLIHYTSIFVLLLLMGLLLSGCKKEHTSREASDLVGDYALVSVDRKQLPAQVTHEGVALQVRSGNFTINPDGTCSTKTIFIPPSGTEATRQVNATYTREGSSLQMEWHGAGVTKADVESGTLTMNNEGMLFVYRK